MKAEPDDISAFSGYGSCMKHDNALKVSDVQAPVASKMKLSKMLGYVSLLLLTGLVMFHVALMCGAPWGSVVWSQATDILRWPDRIRSLLAILYLLFMIWIAAKGSGLLHAKTPVYFFVGAVFLGVGLSVPGSRILAPETTAQFVFGLVSGLTELIIVAACFARQPYREEKPGSPHLT